MVHEIAEKLKEGKQALSMYASWPKSEFGKLGLVVQQHGWYVKGLELTGDS